MTKHRFASVRGRDLAAACVLLFAGASAAHSELIRPEHELTLIVPGANASSQVLLTHSSTPLFGYSLRFEVTPLAGASGAITIDTALTNFFDSHNLITAGGAQRDPLFSVILSTPNGAFLSTNTDDLSTVIASPGVNDVLAQLVFSASADAIGMFEYRVIAGSALSDAFGSPVAYDAVAGFIVVVPAPASAMIVIFGLFGGRRRRTTR